MLSFSDCVVSDCRADRNRACTVVPRPDNERMAAVPFAVECPCGGVARGERRAQPQLAACPTCGKELFVFPVSPALPALLENASPSALQRVRLPTLPPLSPRVKFWLAPSVAAALGLVAVGFVITSIVRGTRADDGRSMTEARAATELADVMARFPDLCERGSYHIAAAELAAAQTLWQRFPRALSDDKARQLRRWARQSALAADLSSESLGEIVRHAAGLDAREWKAVFDARYRDKAIILDAQVTRLSNNRYAVDYQLDDDGLVGEWDFEDFALLRTLNLAKAERLVLGMRLASIERVGRDRWIVKPRPNSGVLFTEPAVFAQLSLSVDDALRDRLRIQAEWDAE